MKNKYLPILIIIPILILGSFLLFKNKSAPETSASVSRNGLTLDLDFGNNNGSATPTVYDSSGFARHATSTAGATSPTCNQHRCDFNGSQYMTANATNVFNSANISIAIKFTPDFAANVVASRFIVDTTDASRYLVWHQADGDLDVWLGHQDMPDISLATYEPYWKVGEENILVIVATDGTDRTDAWLNGYKIKNNDTTDWTLKNPAKVTFGGNVGVNQMFDGKIHYLKVWNRLLTDDEVAILSADRETTANTAPRSGATGSSTGTLVGYWTMDANDINSTTIYDKSGQGNNGTITGALVSEQGKINQAQIFDGTNDWINAGQAGATLTDNFTLSAWIKSSVDNTRILARRTAAAGTQWDFYLQATSGSLALYDGTAIRGSGVSLIDNKWHLATVVINGANSQFYVDGSKAGAVFTPTISAKSVDTEIGSYGGGTSKMNGAIDDVRIYNYALSADEVANLYVSTKQNISRGLPRLGLVGYWNMNADDIGGNGSTTTTFDKSGQGNHGTFYGFHSSMPPTSTPGKIAEAIDFDGSNGYIDLGNTMDTFGFVDKTICAWFKTEEIKQAFIVALPYTKYYLSLDSGKIAVTTYDTTYNVLKTTWSYKTNQWYHVCGILESDTNRYLYINGALDISDTYGSIATTANLYSAIGDKGLSGNGQYFNGQLDEVMIYNRALSAEEVQDLYLYRWQYLR